MYKLLFEIPKIKFQDRFQKDKPFFIRFNATYSHESRSQTGGDFVGVGRFAPDEERIVLLKAVVQFYFTYSVSRGFSIHLFIL